MQDFKIIITDAHENKRLAFHESYNRRFLFL